MYSQFMMHGQKNIKLYTYMLRSPLRPPSGWLTRILIEI